MNTVAPWRWKFPSGRCGSSKATESSSRHQAPPSLLEVMFPLAGCVTGSLRFSPSSSALWPEPKVSRPQPFCLFCLSSFVPTADSIGSASPKKEAVLGLGAYLLALFVQLCVRICSGTSFHRPDYLLPCTSYNPLYLLSPRGLELLTRSGPILSILLPCLVGPPSGCLLV